VEVWECGGRGRLLKFALGWLRLTPEAFVGWPRADGRAQAGRHELIASPPHCPRRFRRGGEGGNLIVRNYPAAPAR